MKKIEYEKPYFELIDLQYEIFTEDSTEYNDDDDPIFGGSFSTIINMIKQTIGFDYDEKGYLVDGDGNRLEVDENGNYHDKDGNVFRLDENGRLIDENGNVVFGEEKTSDTETQTENPEKTTPDGETSEETSDQSTPSETDLDQLDVFADEIADAVGDGGSGDITIPDSTSSGNEGSISEGPIVEEPVNETPITSPDGNYGFDGE